MHLVLTCSFSFLAVSLGVASALSWVDPCLLLQGTGSKVSASLLSWVVPVGRPFVPACSAYVCLELFLMLTKQNLMLIWLSLSWTPLYIPFYWSHETDLCSVRSFWFRVMFLSSCWEFSWRSPIPGVVSVAVWRSPLSMDVWVSNICIDLGLSSWTASNTPELVVHSH